MQPKATSITASVKKALTIFAPFLFLLLLFALARLVLPERQDQEAALSIGSTAVPAATSDAGVATPSVQQPTRETPFTPPPSATPVNTATPTATPFVPPTFPAGSDIELLGPPPDSRFAKDERVSFFWRWSQTLAEDQSFLIVLRTDSEEIDMGTMAEPNLGNAYAFSVPMADLVTAAGPVQWQVRLVTSFSGSPLLASEERSITLQDTP